MSHLRRSRASQIVRGPVRHVGDPLAYPGAGVGQPPDRATATRAGEHVDGRLLFRRGGQGQPPVPLGRPAKSELGAYARTWSRLSVASTTCRRGRRVAFQALRPALGGESIRRREEATLDVQVPGHPTPSGFRRHRVRGRAVSRCGAGKSLRGDNSIRPRSRANAKNLESRAAVRLAWTPAPRSATRSMILIRSCRRPQQPADVR